jgi:hypothetical protein
VTVAAKTTSPRSLLANPKERGLPAESVREDVVDVRCGQHALDPAVEFIRRTCLDASDDVRR